MAPPLVLSATALVQLARGGRCDLVILGGHHVAVTETLRAVIAVDDLEVLGHPALMGSADGAWFLKPGVLVEVVDTSRPNLHLLDDADWLHDAYIVQGRTMADIAAECEVAANSVRAALLRHHIPIRKRPPAVNRPSKPRKPRWGDVR